MECKPAAIRPIGPIGPTAKQLRMNVLLSEVGPVAELTDVPAEFRDQLTRSPLKSGLYALDNYFREGFWTFGSELPELLGLALCMLKPEATAGRRLRSALDILADSGFHPTDVVPFRHNRWTVREVWRYQFNIATRERVEAMDVVLPSTDTVCLVLRDAQWAPGRLPAAVRLNSLKGPADPAQRRPEHLRHRLGVVNGLFNFLHISDEPIDVVREIAVLCDAPRREAMRARIRTGHDAIPETLAVFDELERRYPEHDFDLDASWARLLDRADETGAIARRHASGEQVPIGELLAVARALPLDASCRWDVLTVITHLLEVMNVPGVAPTVPDVTAEWTELT